MNALQSFIAARPFGFIRDTDLPELIALHRLCQCLVRCGGCRFVCAAQDVAHLQFCIRAGGDYVRDVSITAREIERAADWKPEPQLPAEQITRRPALEPAPCQHLQGYWINRKARTFRCLSCGHQFHLDQIARHPGREIGPWNPKPAAAFNEADCGGAFDGRQVTSDADPGL